MSRFLPSTTVGRVRALLGGVALLPLGILLAGPSGVQAWQKMQAFVADGGAPADMPWELDVDLGLALAAAVNLVLLAGLMLTAGWWTRPFTAEPKTPCIPRRRLPGMLWALLLAATVLGVVVRLPLAQRSLWWDELWSLRQCSHGQWKPDTRTEDPNDWRFSATSWKRCAFYYQKPTNHAPVSLLQKACLSGWRALTGAPPSEMRDIVARLPALAASAVAMLLCGVLLWEWGAAGGACLAAALLMGLHPLALRYGVDTRAYCLVLALVPAALLAMTRLWRGGGRGVGPWVALGAVFMLWLWAFPHGLTDVIILGSVTALGLGRRYDRGRDRATALSRLLVTGVLAAMALLQVYLPCFLQARRYLGKEADQHGLDLEQLKQTLAELLTGLPWRDAAYGTELGGGLRDLVHLGPQPVWGLAVAVGLALAVGVAIARGRRRSGGLGGVWMLGLPLLSAALFGLMLHLTEGYFYTRFVIATVPAITMALGSLADSRFPRWLIPGWLVVLLAAGVYLYGGTIYQQRPIEPVRDVAQWLEAHAEDARAVAYGHGKEAVAVLAPRVHPADSAAEIRQQWVEAKNAKEPPLLLVVGHIGFNRALLPDGFTLIEDPARFTEVARFEGSEAEHQYRIYRARLHWD